MNYCYCPYSSETFQLLSKCLQKAFTILNIKNATKVKSACFLPRAKSLITILSAKEV